MRACLACLLALAAACGDDGGGNNPDGGGSGDGSGSQGQTVTLTLTNRPDNAAMFTFVVAYQDGTGPWTVAPAPSGDTYSFQIASPTYTVAWTCVANLVLPQQMVSARQVVFARFATSERTSLTMAVPPRCTDKVTPVAVMGNVTNLSGGGNFLVAVGVRLGIVNPSTGNYRVEAIPGMHDLLVLRTQTGLMTGDRVIDRVAIVRGLNITAAMTQNVDFSTSQPTQAFPVTFNVTGRLNATTTLHTANDATNADIVDLSNAPFETRALAAAQAMAGDVYDQAMVVSANGQTAATINTTATPAAQTWAAPAALGGAIATIASSAPYAQISSTWPTYASAVGYLWSVTQNTTAQECGGTTACTLTWSALISPGAAGMMPGFQMPDLSALAGWAATLQPLGGVTLNGFASALTSSLGATDFPYASPAPAGTQRTIARSDFTVTP
jgi:hypothetical protein